MPLLYTNRLVCTIRRAFQPLVDAGFVEIVYGGSEQGKQLCEHPGVASIHLTGSAATYNAIVWGDNIEKVLLAEAETSPGYVD